MNESELAALLQRYGDEVAGVLPTLVTQTIALGLVGMIAGLVFIIGAVGVVVWAGKVVTKAHTKNSEDLDGFGMACIVMAIVFSLTGVILFSVGVMNFIAPHVQILHSLIGGK